MDDFFGNIHVLWHKVGYNSTSVLYEWMFYMNGGCYEVFKAIWNNYMYFTYR